MPPGRAAVRRPAPGPWRRRPGTRGQPIRERARSARRRAGPRTRISPPARRSGQAGPSRDRRTRRRRRRPSRDCRACRRACSTWIEDREGAGRSTPRARRGRRQLLAAVGGGIRAVLAEGIRTWIFLAVIASLTAILALPAASIVRLLLGLRSTSSMLVGMPGSLATAGVVVGGFAYLGWVLPARIAGPAVRSVFGVRRGVALIGLALGSAVLWFLVSVAMDPVLAVGLPLGPVAFALAAFRAPERPTFRVGFVPAVIGVAVLFLPMTLLALATATDPHSDNWMADTSPI